jgi:nicotinamidase-related amidase
MRPAVPDDYTRPQFDAAALVTIDLQCDFIDGTAPIAGTADALPRVQDAVRWFRAAGRPIVHVVRLYEPDGSNVDACRRALIEGGHHVVHPGSAGSELAAELRLTPDARLDAPALLRGEFQVLGPSEWAMYKPRWGAFYGTRLEDHLRALGVTTLVFAGCNFPNCPRTSVYEASERDFRIVVVSDALSGLYDQGVRELENIGVTMLTAAELARNPEAPAHGVHRRVRLR